MAKKSKSFKYFEHGKESQTVQAGAVLLVLGSVLLLYLIAAKYSLFG